MNTPDIRYPRVPETLDGWATLHEFFRFDWTAWKQTDSSTQNKVIEESISVLSKVCRPVKGQSACFAMLGHKADLMFLHFRPTLDDLSQAQLDLRRSDFFRFLVPTTSYVSFVELGMYEMTVKIYEELLEKGIPPDSEEWQREWKKRLDEQASRMGSRTFCEIPNLRYVCFYPMNKRRGEIQNWYDVSMEDRQMMMREHGLIGRKYTGQVTQIISGSIGTDDWEWGVDLFSNNPLVFKKLVYEMRFDKASAVYGEFGSFFVGMQFDCENLPQFLSGQTPALTVKS